MELSRTLNSDLIKALKGERILIAVTRSFAEVDRIGIECKFEFYAVLSALRLDFVLECETLSNGFKAEYIKLEGCEDKRARLLSALE